MHEISDEVIQQVLTADADVWINDADIGVVADTDVGDVDVWDQNVAAAEDTTDTDRYWRWHWS